MPSHEGRKRPLEDVLAEVDRFGCDLVEVTGGEPLLQEDVYPLMEALVARGNRVLLETGGHRSIERGPARRRHHHGREMPRQRRDAPHGLGEPRPPAAARRGEVRHQGPRRLRLRAEVLTRYDLASRVTAIHCSRRPRRAGPAPLSEWVLADRLPVRVQVQLHKYDLGRRRTRGV